MKANLAQQPNASANHSLRTPQRLVPNLGVARCKLSPIFLLLLLLLPATVQAQFNYTTNDGTITITGYTGSGGAVVLPDTINGLPVTTIGGQAFFNQPSVTSITISDGITTIGDGAFDSCSSLANVAFGSGVTTIGRWAFYNCIGLNSVLIPNSVTSIGEAAFSRCVILASVTIDNSVTTIGNAAFNYCTSLTNVSFGNSVTSIGAAAFADCTSLNSVTIPDSVTSIGDYAFSSCTSLRGVYFQGNAPSLGVSVFSVGSPATVYYLPGTTGWGDTFGGRPAMVWNPLVPYNYTINSGSITIKGYTGPGSAVAIPGAIDGLPVTRIGDSAFYYRSDLTSVIIPDSVTDIGGSAFSGCTSLTNVAIGNGVANIGESAFASCSSLTSVTIPDSVTSIGDYAFYGCTRLTNVKIGNSVTSIGDSAFFECSSLASVTIGNSVASIGSSAFSGCTSLTSVAIPDSVTSLGGDAFGNCASLTSVTIGNSVANIGEWAFASCSNLTSVTIGNSVTSLGGWAFAECTSLTSVTIGNSVTSIGGSAFFECSSLVSVTIPDSVTSLGDYAFLGCSSLTSVTIGNSATNIGGGTFYGCSSLTSVTIPDSVTSIGVAAFAESTSLTSVAIPDSVTSLGDDAFRNCASLTSVTIPDSVTSIGDDAFSHCFSLSVITVDTNNLVYSSMDGVLFNKIQITLIQCPALKAGSYTIPNSVISIGAAAFAECTSLTSVAIPDSVTSLGDYAFGNCASLTSVTIGNNVTNIGIYAFFNCDSLASVTIPASTIRVASHAFDGCRSLNGVYFQGNAPSVGSDVFSSSTIVFYLPGTTGWGPTFGGHPAMLVFPESDRLLVRATGRGTFSPNYSEAMLKPGRTYSMTGAGADGYTFARWILSTNWSGGVAVTTPRLTFVMQPGLTVQVVFVDVTRPKVTITSPLAGQRVSNALVTVRGLATDNAQLTQVLCQINDGDWVPATGTSNWTASLPLTPGTNRVRVFAMDAVGHSSPTDTVTFVHVAISQFTLLTNGLGRVSRNFTGNTLEVGRGYTVTATPSAGQWFSNWTGTVTATNNPLKFLMQSNLVLQANFVPNPYLALKGTYAGLFSPPSTETASGTNADNAGSVTLTLTERGTFSGSLRLAGAALAFAGRFDVGRQASVKVSRLGKAPLWLNLGFDAQTITGQVSTAAWVADLLALRRATATSNAFAGRYSMLVFGQHDATNTPPGDSPLTVSVSAPSSVTVSGTMADGSVVTLATGHSAEGVWPFHASLYGGRGLVMGWMSCATNSELQVLWVKPADAAARYYPAGFREERPAALQRYQPPALKQTATSWSTGRLLIGGGNLVEPLEAEVLVTNNLVKTLSGSMSNLTLVITNSNGRFGGSFLHPVTRKTTPLHGILVQGLPWVAPAEQVTVGGGWFVGTNQSGYLWLEPKL